MFTVVFKNLNYSMKLLKLRRRRRVFHRFKKKMNFHGPCINRWKQETKRKLRKAKVKATRILKMILMINMVNNMILLEFSFFSCIVFKWLELIIQKIKEKKIPKVFDKKYFQAFHVIYYFFLMVLIIKIPAVFNLLKQVNFHSKKVKKLLIDWFCLVLQYQQQMTIYRTCMKHLKGLTPMKLNWISKHHHLPYWLMTNNKNIKKKSRT